MGITDIRRITVPPRLNEYPRRRRFCIGCGIAFVAAHSTHQLCRDCFRWHLVIRSMRIVNRVLREARHEP